MTRNSIGLLSAAILLSGCVAPPYGYAPGAYPNGAYPPPAGYPPAAYAPGPEPGQPYVGPDGLTYVDGYPVADYEGVSVPWVFLPELGGWGYYDNVHRWHGAPPDLRDRLERAHPGGRGLPPANGFRQPVPGGAPPRGPAPGRYPEQGHYQEQGPGQGRAPGPGPGPGQPPHQAQGRPAQPQSPQRQAPAQQQGRGESGGRACPADHPHC